MLDFAKLSIYLSMLQELAFKKMAKLGPVPIPDASMHEVHSMKIDQAQEGAQEGAYMAVTQM